MGVQLGRPMQPFGRLKTLNNAATTTTINISHSIHVVAPHDDPLPCPLNQVKPFPNTIITYEHEDA